MLITTLFLIQMLISVGAKDKYTIDTIYLPLKKKPVYVEVHTPTNDPYQMPPGYGSYSVNDYSNPSSSAAGNGKGYVPSCGATHIPAQDEHLMDGMREHTMKNRNDYVNKERAEREAREESQRQYDALPQHEKDRIQRERDEVIRHDNEEAQRKEKARFDKYITQHYEVEFNEVFEKWKIYRAPIEKGYITNVKTVGERCYIAADKLIGDSTVLHKDNYQDQGSAYENNDLFERSRILLRIADKMMDAAVSIHPVTGLVRDIIEFVTGKDVWTHENLSAFERTMAGMGMAIGASTAGIAAVPFKIISAFDKLKKYVIEDLAAVEKVMLHKPQAEVVATLEFFKEHKIYHPMSLNMKMSVADAFMQGAKKRILTEDLIVYRYYDPLHAEARGVWVTTNGNIANPEMELALQYSGNYIAHKWTIPKGTEILEGVVAPKWGKPGGAYQILVNMEVLR